MPLMMALLRPTLGLRPHQPCRTSVPQTGSRRADQLSWGTRDRWAWRSCRRGRTRKRPSPAVQPLARWVRGRAWRAARSPFLPWLFVVGRHVGDVLLRQRVGDTAHGGVLAVALFVGIECRGDVLAALARNHWAPCALQGSWIGSPKCRGSQCTWPFSFAGLHVYPWLPGHGESGHRSDSQGKYRGQRLVHFARTISWRFSFSSGPRSAARL